MPAPNGISGAASIDPALQPGPCQGSGLDLCEEADPCDWILCDDGLACLGGQCIEPAPVEPSVELQVMEEIQESTEALLMEGVRQLDEFRNLQKQLPPLGSPLAVPTPLAGKLRELSPSELDTFQLVLDHGQLQKVLDNFPGTDLDAAQNIISLMKREFVVVP